jgi:hypothetical protein
VTENADEVKRLEEILATARALAEDADPLLRGQYGLLIGQIEALLAILGGGD